MNAPDDEELDGFSKGDSDSDNINAGLESDDDDSYYGDSSEDDDFDDFNDFDDESDSLTFDVDPFDE